MLFNLFHAAEVTAVFCQSAIESAQKDHATVVQNMIDNKESHLDKLRTLFSHFDLQECETLSCPAT